MKEQTVKVDFGGKEISVSVYLKKTSEKWLVCFHGLQACKELFADLFAQDFAKPYSLLAMDFVGFGNSDNPEKFSYSLEDQENVCMAVMQKLGISDCIIIGHSLGGMVGTMLAQSMPDVVKGFVNLEGNLVGSDCGSSKADITSLSMAEFEKTGHSKFLEKVKKSEEKGTKKRVAWLKQIPPYVLYKTSVSIVKISDSEKMLKSYIALRQRKIYIFGSRCMGKTKSLEGKAEYVIIPDAGHRMILENPEATYAQIGKFLGK